MKQYGAVQFQMTEFSSTVNQLPHHVKQEVKVLHEQSVIPLINARFCTLKQQMDKFQNDVLKEMKEQIRKEINNGFELQKSSLEDSVLSAVTRSQAETPAPSMFDQQEQIRGMLQLGQINKAFHQALLNSDLNLLEYTLEKADFNAVFKSPCPLEQNVLMSLIAQLTVDMSRYSELKNR
jgi:enhancer of mRNA-decapping protein 4